VIPQAVYLACALTSFVCAALLLRGYLQGRARLLLWSSLAFVAFAFNNGLLFVDLVMVPDVDFSLLRAVLSLAGALVLVFGLIWDGEP
jgi:hypothetical protein